MAGGGSGGTFDPTLLYAMAQQRRGAVQNSFQPYSPGGTPGPYAYGR